MRFSAISSSYNTIGTVSTLSPAQHDYNLLCIMSVQIQNLLKMDNPEDFEFKAKKLHNFMNDFNKIVRRNSNAKFNYSDVLERELSTLNNEQIVLLDCFSAKVMLVPFDALASKSHSLMLKDGNTVDYSISEVQVGNKAIGQVWLSCGIEAFSPRIAINNSINSSLSMLSTWIDNFKFKIQEAC